MLSDMNHVDKRADFFGLGGDSLTAATVAGDIRGVLGVEVDLAHSPSTPCCPISRPCLTI